MKTQLVHALLAQTQVQYSYKAIKNVTQWRSLFDARSLRYLLEFIELQHPTLRSFSQRQHVLSRRASLWKLPAPRTPRTPSARAG